jgi:uncharacterized protein (UPF0332 family)
MTTFDWNDYITLARAMRADASEAHYRSAISRAYYGAYNQAKQRFFDDGETFGYKGESHAQVWNYFQKQNDRDYKAIGVFGDRARERRRRADYEDRFPNLDNEVGVSLNAAQEVVNRLQKTAPQAP